MTTGSGRTTSPRRFRAFYGAHPLHLLALLGCFALAGYIVAVMGPAALWDSPVWWQTAIVWFVGSVVLHDLVLFPLYALADRAVTGLWRRRRRGTAEVAAVNFVRVPALASGLTFLLFFPGIVRQGAHTYVKATGQTQEPFLTRWLLFTAICFGVSAVAYAVRVALVRNRGTEPPEESGGQPDPLRGRRRRGDPGG